MIQSGQNYTIILNRTSFFRTFVPIIIIPLIEFNGKEKNSIHFAGNFSVSSEN
jgi:hypothetical protein